MMDHTYLRKRDVLANILLPELVNLLQERGAHQMTILTKALDVGHGGGDRERFDQVRSVGYQKTKHLELDRKCLIGCPRWHGDTSRAPSDWPDEPFYMSFPKASSRPLVIQTRRKVGYQIPGLSGIHLSWSVRLPSHQPAILRLPAGRHTC
jgi:hypothetical protein